MGGCDSFGGGLIYSLLSGFDMQDTIELAVAASCLKHSIEGDFNLVSADEVKNLAKARLRQSAKIAQNLWARLGRFIIQSIFRTPAFYLYKRRLLANL